MSEYSDRVAERRNWALRDISRAIYGAALALTLANVAMAVLIIYAVTGAE